MRNRSENQITVVMIRHGATRLNKEHRYLGRTDEPLSEDGKKEVIKYKQMQNYPTVQYLFTSPMKRCLETADFLYPGKKPVIIPELAEMDFGAFEGKNYLDLKEDERYQAWIDSNGTLPFPEGESREEFILRCVSGFQSIVKELTAIEENSNAEVKTVGMVVHGGTIMALLSRYCGGDYFDYQVSNGSGYICTLDNWKTEPTITQIRKIEIAVKCREKNEKLVKEIGEIKAEEGSVV